VLLDIRNVVPIHNGTTQAALGCVRALRRLAPRWDVAVLTTPAAVAFHQLESLCGDWQLHTTPPEASYTAALRLSQPWHIQEMIDLHRAALFNAYFMLDTISWDVVYAAPTHLDGTWGFLADHADGYLFDSAFTERRFLTRFDVRQAVRAVCHYPFAPAEYVRGSVRDTGRKGSLLVFGNELDHKDVAQTVDLLADAFPFERIVCFGPASLERPGVRVCRSGNLSEEDVHQIYADAGIVILPSFYEGFGFPIVTGLAYGKTVIARRSELLEELARYCTTGQLIAFERREDLVETLGRLRQGEDVESVPLGSAVSGKPRVWLDVAADIVRFLESLVSQSTGSRWRERERVVNQLLAFRA
jgi:hypothetical protein